MYILGTYTLCVWEIWEGRGGGGCGERVVTSLVPRLSPLAYTEIVFYYLTFDLALAQKALSRIFVAIEFRGQNYRKGGEPENEAR